MHNNAYVKILLEKIGTKTTNITYENKRVKVYYCFHKKAAFRILAKTIFNNVSQI